MRVLVLSSVFPNSKDPLFGVFVRERIKRLAPRCEIVVVAPVAWTPFNRLFRGSNRSNIPPFEIQDGLSVYHPKFFSLPGICKSLDGLFYYLSVLPLLRRLRRKFAFDLIDAHFVYPDGLAACLLAKTFACPVTITLRGTIGKLSKFFLRRKQIRWSLRSASRVFSVSESLRDIAVDLGCDRQKLRVIPNGVDGNVFRPINQTDARRRIELPLNQTVLLSVGALAERKGHQRIVKVLPRIVATHPNLLYIVVGGPGAEGDTGPLLRRLSIELGMEQHLRLVGPRPHKEIAYWIAAADLFCLATSNEGMANVILEALSCGVPVVTTRVGGNAELIRHGKNGLLYSLGDEEAMQTAILEGLTKKWDRSGIARETRGRTWDSAAHQVMQEWSDAVSIHLDNIKSKNVSAAT